MNLAFNPVTRRAFRANYVSPDVCQPMVVSSGSSSSGTGSSISGVLDFTNEPKAGPVLSVFLSGDDSFLLSWSSVSDAIFYNLYRATSLDGPFTRIVEGVSGLSYVDIPEGDGPFFYYATALEPSYGETLPSNTVVASFEESTPVPIALGAHLWLAPESQVFSDLAGTVPAVSGGEIRYWQDLSGNGYHATMPVIPTVAGPRFSTSSFDGFRMVDFRQGVLPDTSIATRCALLTPSITIPPTNIGHGGATVFAVCRMESGYGEGYGQVFGWNGRELAFRRNDLNVQMSGFMSPSSVAPDPTGVNAYTMKAYAFRFTSGIVNDEEGYGNEIQLHVNQFGTVASSANITELTVPSKVGIGFAEDLITSAYFGGHIVELILVGRSLLNQEVRDMLAYLHNKYPSI